MKNFVTIDWIKSYYKDLGNYDHSPFYSISQGRGLTYIGIAYHQDVIDEVRQTLYAFSCSYTVVNVWLGYITDCSFQRISSQIIEETESALIHAHQPHWNTKEKSTYYTRNNLTIISNGCPFLYPKIVSKVDGLEIHS